MQPDLHYSAPAKVVLWGEYAVLDGAPAAVMAIERRAHVRADKRDHGWCFTADGLLAANVHVGRREFCHAEITRQTECILQHFGYEEFPAGLALHIDTRAFYQAGSKLGIGSSAAVCTALYRLLGAHLGQATDLDSAMAIHRRWQGDRGSGLDVATAWHGGVIHFRAGQVSTATLPDHMHWSLIWTGSSAATPTQLQSFAQWRERGDSSPFEALKQATTSLHTSVDMDLLANYCGALRTFDAAAKLGIYTDQHLKLERLAFDYNLLYKPCGAGGGDIGIAFAADVDALAAFTARAQAHNFCPLPTEIAADGVQCSP
ncbi:MAG: hypothetical protein AAF513_02055 [Pseudomonadota bacterium]